MEKEYGYCGVSYGSLDGSIIEANLDGDQPYFTLSMTVGGKRVQCASTPDHSDIIIENLNRRVDVYGSKTYDGTDRFPVHVAVRSISPVPQGHDFSKWRGAFEGLIYESAEWGDTR